MRSFCALPGKTQVPWIIAKYPKKKPKINNEMRTQMNIKLL